MIILLSVLISLLLLLRDDGIHRKHNVDKNLSHFAGKRFRQPHHSISVLPTLLIIYRRRAFAHIEPGFEPLVLVDGVILRKNGVAKLACAGEVRKPIFGNNGKTTRHGAKLYSKATNKKKKAR